MWQQTILIGHLGNDPEMRFTNTGTPVTSFRIAVSKSWNDANGKRQEKTVWFKATAWRKTAEIAAQYLKKGSKVQIIGEMEEPQAFTDKSGNQRASNEITINSFTFLDSRDSGNHEQAESITQGNGAPVAKVEPADIPF